MSLPYSAVSLSNDPVVIIVEQHMLSYADRAPTSRQIGQLLYDSKLGLRFIRQRCVAWAINNYSVHIRKGRSFGLYRITQSVKAG
jgi:hypothetical protein